MEYFAFQWHITDECDQRCKHCYIFSENICKHLDSMSWAEMQETFYNCLDFCAVHDRLPYFYITGGDPILHPDFWQLLELLTELSRVKREYDRLADALASVRATGYGVVGPGPEELKLEKPEVLKKNGSYGVKLRAMAPSIHMIRVDVDTEISPMVGGEEQSKELIEYLGGQEPEKLWQSNIFGKSVYDLIQEGLNAKLLRLPEDVRTKFRGTLGRIVNEGATGLVCLIL